MRPGYRNHDLLDDTSSAQIIACLDVRPIAPIGILANATLETLERRLGACGEKLQGEITSCPRRRDEPVASYLQRTFLDMESPQARTRLPLLESLKLAQAHVLWRIAKEQEEAKLKAAADAAEMQRDRERLRVLANPDPVEIQRNLAIIAKAERAERILGSLLDLLADHRSAARARAAINRTFVEMDDARRRLSDETMTAAPDRPDIPPPPADLRDKLQEAAREIVRM